MDVRVAPCVSARARLVVPARGKVEPGTRAHRAWGRAGRKQSWGAGEVEDEPHSGTEREGGAAAAPAGANRPRSFRPAPSFLRFAGAGPGRFGGGKGGERGGGWRLGGSRIPRGGRDLAVAGMSSGQDGGPRSPGRDPELQVEAAEMRRVGRPLLLGQKVSEKAAASGREWRVRGRGGRRWALAAGAAVRGSSGHSWRPEA